MFWNPATTHPEINSAAVDAAPMLACLLVGLALLSLTVHAPGPDCTDVQLTGRDHQQRTGVQIVFSFIHSYVCFATMQEHPS